MGYSYGEIKDALKAVSETEEITEYFYEEKEGDNNEKRINDILRLS